MADRLHCAWSGHYSQGEAYPRQTEEDDLLREISGMQTRLRMRIILIIIIIMK